MDNEAENLRAAFGDSSDGEDGADEEAIAIGDSTVWERVEEVKGLWLCRNFISIHHQSDLLSAILNGTLRSSLVSNSNDLFYILFPLKFVHLKFLQKVGSLKNILTRYQTSIVCLLIL